MNKSYQIKKWFSTIIFIVAFFSLEVKADEVYLVPSFDIHLATWTGGDAGTTDSYTAASNMSVLGLMLQKDRWYTGLLLKSGNFKFETLAPEQDNGTVVTPTEINHGDFDLVAGYYFWERVALFVDLKATSMSWIDSDYIVSSGGIGLGVSGYYPLKNSTLYSSIGIVSLTSKVNEIEVGTGAGSSLEFGWLKTISSTMKIKVGVKSQTQVIDYASSNKQTNNINGIIVGISKAFTL